MGRFILRKLLVYRRPFPSLAEAERSFAALGISGHEAPANAEHHLQLNERARPSDYAALFHLQRVMPSVRRIFDFGGNVGNLYYCYAGYLKALQDVDWMVMDLPANVARGRRLAEERGASHLLFSDNWQDAGSADLLIVSGCLHYLEKTIAQMVAELKAMPPYLLINRAALTEGTPVATVHDNGLDFFASILHNRGEVIRGLEELGYVLEDQWQAAELSVEIPGHPEHRVPSYSGMFFRRSDVNLPASVS